MLLDDLDFERAIAQMAKSALNPAPVDKREPLAGGLLAAGLGILANNNGRTPAVNAIGQGGLYGLQTYNDLKRQQQKDPGQQMALAASLLGLQNNLIAYQQNRDRRDVLRDMAGGQRGTSDYAPGESPESYTGAVAPNKPMVLQPSASRNLTHDYYTGLAQRFASRGLVDDANKYLQLAEKYRPELKDQRVMTDPNTGERRMYNVFKDGTIEAVPYGPDAEKLHIADTGSALQGLDPFTGKPVGASIAKSMTPGEETTDERSREQFGLTQQLERDRMRQSDKHFYSGQSQSERHFQQGLSKPHFVETADGVYGVNPVTLGAQAVTGTDGKPLQNSKPLTEAQAKAHLFGSRMEAASSILGNLEAKTGLFDPSSPLNKSAGASGIWTPMNYMAPKDAQSYMQAQRNWSEAELRQKTGAAVTAKEIDDNVKIYFPQPGDGLDVIRQKADARAIAERGMRVVMGPAGERQLPQRSAPLQDNKTATWKAQQAIKAGADPDAVRRRLIEQGYSARGLQ